ncbi:MAG: TonB C-terminal domain-containing protein [Zoogloeaceae bacterium]|jgi:outer membrane biosynthesis protein TonB|nr:TonB C-terminal domain-containing protein [Zoogloeaceae bacterium]
MVSSFSVFPTPGPKNGRGALVLALVLSLTAHGLVLARLLQLPPPTAPQGSPLSVRLSGVPEATGKSSDHQGNRENREESAQPPQETPARELPPPRAKEKPALPKKTPAEKTILAVPMPQTETTTSTGEIEATLASAAASLPETASHAANAADTAQPSASGAGTGIGAGTGSGQGTAAAPAGEEQAEITERALREYRYALGRTGRRVLSEVSRRFRDSANLTEETTVRVRLEWRLGVSRIHVQKSSGNAQLDALALEILREAVARTPLPPVLRQHSFETILPVQTQME